MRWRLVAILAASLTPILVISAVQAYFDARDGQSIRRNELVLAADRSIDRVQESFEAAERFLAVFAEEIARGDCDAVGQRISNQLPSLSNVFFSTPNGETVCATNSAFLPPQADVSREFGAGSVHTRFLHRTQEDAAGLVLQVPVGHSGEEPVGSAGFVLGLGAILNQMAVPVLPEGVTIVLADSHGDLFGPTPLVAIDREWIGEALETRQGLLVQAKDGDGTVTDVVLKRVLSDEVFAVISRPSPTLLSEASLRPARLFGLPLLAFSVTLLSAWLAIDHLALRWLSRLRQLARAYGDGDYSARADETFNQSPEEVKALAATFNTMAIKISERDDELTDSLSLQEALVREVHHRVKNNLQIITSSLSLQSRQLRDPAGRDALAAARHRIDALSIVHNTLYQHERLETVDAKPFLDGLLRHLKDALAMDEAGITLSVDINETKLEADAAIPVALFTVEAVTNAVKYAFDADGGEISVGFEVDAGDHLLSVSDNGGGDSDSAEEAVGSGLGSRFMSAFARQLHGKMNVRNTPSEGYGVELRFPSSLTRS